MSGLAQSLRRPIPVATAVVAVLGLAAELAYAALPGSSALDAVVDKLSLSSEQNLPTWYASCLLAGCAVVLAAIARDAFARQRPWRRHWAGLAAGFAVMSLDETAELHEHLADVVDAGDLIYFNWIIPAGLVVVALAAVYLPFLRAQPARERRRMILAAALYLGGAVAMELPLGWWTAHHGDDNLGYALIDWVEESLELAGASYFLWLVAGRWDRRAEAAP